MDCAMSLDASASLPAFPGCSRETTAIASPSARGLSELRMFFGPGYRVYFGEHQDDVVIVLCGGDKDSQSKDIPQAKTYWKEYLSHEEL
jgi:putative addiction module killer protein